MKIDNNMYSKDLSKRYTYISEISSFSLRKKTILIIVASLIFLVFIFLRGIMIDENNLYVDFSNKLKGPSIKYIFGTDANGRNMYLRTIKGLSTSLLVGAIGSLSSLIIATLFSLFLSIGNNIIDKIVNFIIDIFLSIPHMMLLILIAVGSGRGIRGVIIGIALTHWTSLTRILRGEIMAIKNENYIAISKAMGKTKFYIFVNHILPSLFSQMLIGLVLLFPHAILHESAISFLGFGLSLSTPSIGIILSESMKYLIQGYWYLAFFPGFLLFFVVFVINSLGENIKHLVDPYSYHR